MRVILFLLSIGTFALAVMLILSGPLVAGKNQTVILLLFLISAVFFVGAAVVDAIVNGRKAILKELRKGEPEPTVPVQDRRPEPPPDTPFPQV